VNDILEEVNLMPILTTPTNVDVKALNSTAMVVTWSGEAMTGVVYDVRFREIPKLIGTGREFAAHKGTVVA
jgi:hypothetical protein